MLLMENMKMMLRIIDCYTLAIIGAGWEWLRISFQSHFLHILTKQHCNRELNMGAK